MFSAFKFGHSEVVLRLLDLVWTASDSLSSTAAHGYLKKLFGSQQVHHYLPEILSNLKLNNRSFGWAALSQIASSFDTTKAYDLTSLLLTLLRDEAISNCTKINFYWPYVFL